ncbi:MAG: radical SAM protein [Candidatus Krumholzibacteriales bacterium]
MSDRGVIFDIKRFAIHDGPGIRSTVFFQGCPLDCPWCHNPEGKNRLTCRDLSRPEKLKSYNLRCRCLTPGQLLREVEKDWMFYDRSGGGVTLSGGEPMMQPEFVSDFLVLCREKGYSTVLDTSGFCRYNYIEMVLDLVDTFYFDLKLADDARHRELTGVSNERILDNLRKLDIAGADTVIRIALIPGYTDSRENIEGLADILSELQNMERVGIIPYNSMCEDKIRRFGMEDRTGRLEGGNEKAMEAARSIFEERGYRVESEV